jgi:hypothetical protein
MTPSIPALRLVKTWSMSHASFALLMEIMRMHLALSQFQHSCSYAGWMDSWALVLQCYEKPSSLEFGLLTAEETGMT